MDKTMLIVDDSEINREILMLLFDQDYMILEATNGKEALAVLEACRGKIDIVLLDLLMPDMGGLELLRARRDMDDFRAVPVVVVTSSNAQEDQITAFELGANDFVNKPFVPEIVRSRVNNVMAAHHRIQMIELEAEKLRVKSELDQMTGLYNKTTTECAITATLSNRSAHTHALLIIDIDDFKSVNDVSGHLAGDHTIRIVADLVSSMFRKTDVVGRIGGDEFAVLMTDVPDMDIVRRKVSELIQLMKYKPNLSIPENVSLSIGFAGTDGEPMTYDELFRRADEALYEAKQNGKAQGHEWGTTSVSLEDDDRRAVLLLSRNRSVCSVVRSMLPQKLAVVEALDETELDAIKPAILGKLILAYVDVSDVEDEMAAHWQQLYSHPWLRDMPVLALCEEGNMEQYREAMLAGAADILSVPLDGAPFRRRTAFQLKKLGLAVEIR